MIVFVAGVLTGFAISLRAQIHFDVWSASNQPHPVQMTKAQRAMEQLWHGQKFRTQRKIIRFCAWLCIAALVGLMLTDPRPDVPHSAPLVGTEGKQP
ncbi:MULTISPECIES: hypothetical protein [unclassified Ensifer]|uniref:hypothetical protein n=1 Tax=unclassified Ensifer TaxID=2633371 RepID=UPI00300FEF00